MKIKCSVGMETKLTIFHNKIKYQKRWIISWGIQEMGADMLD